MIKVAIAGCGKIADQHAEHITALPDCELVAVCDRDELMAGQLRERFQVPQQFTDTAEMIAKARPDVVHIATPPESHFALASLCLQSGCHAYVEKPFTVRAPETAALLKLAEETGRKLTVGHNAQYSHATRRMRDLVRSGYLGGTPVHIESYYCYDLSDPAYAKALLEDAGHWVRTLPGGLLHNTISHGISKIAELLPGDDPTVIAHGFTSAVLESLGERELIDELRVILRQDKTTAYFTFSSQMRPTLHHLRVYGPKNGIMVDEEQQTVIRLWGTRRKSYLEKFVPSWDFSRQYAGNLWRNAKLFGKSDFHMGHGMRALIRAFYDAVEKDAPPPIPYREILLTARVMDTIFAQLRAPQEVTPTEAEFARR